MATTSKSTALSGLIFDYDETQPTQQELLVLFADYLRANNETDLVVAIPNSFGAVKLPKSTPKVVVSVDFCEVIRQTGMACGLAVGDQSVEYPYATTVGLADPERYALTRAVHRSGNIKPSEGSAKILAMLQDIRARGGMVIGNTSTMAGAEIPTIQFITEHYLGAFDGINFSTGTHDTNLDERSKAGAIRTILQMINPDFTPQTTKLTVISIDDRPHHNSTFHAVFKGCDVYSFAPRCRGENPLPVHDSRSLVTDTPLQAFQAAYKCICNIV